jgi:hypothetical protein
VECPGGEISIESGVTSKHNLNIEKVDIRKLISTFSTFDSFATGYIRIVVPTNNKD